MERTVQPRFQLPVRSICRSSASGTSIRNTRETTSPTSTTSCSGPAESSRRLSIRSFCDMRLRRSASLPMSATNSRMVSASISFCKIESESSLIEASGVFSSCEASDTNCRCISSDSCKRSVSLLNSSANIAYSSEPCILILCVYSPSRARRMDVMIFRIRPELTMEKKTEKIRIAASRITELRRMFVSRSAISCPCSAS